MDSIYQNKTAIELVKNSLWSSTIPMEPVWFAKFASVIPIFTMNACVTPIIALILGVKALFLICLILKISSNSVYFHEFIFQFDSWSYGQWNIIIFVNSWNFISHVNSMSYQFQLYFSRKAELMKNILQNSTLQYTFMSGIAATMFFIQVYFN